MAELELPVSGAMHYGDAPRPLEPPVVVVVMLPAVLAVLAAGEVVDTTIAGVDGPPLRVVMIAGESEEAVLAALERAGLVEWASE